MSNLDKQGKKLCKGCKQTFIPREYHTHILEIVKSLRV